MSQPQRLLAPLTLAFLLAWGVLTLWMRERWPRTVLEVGLFALAAAILLATPPRWSWDRVLLLLAAAWPAVQIVAGWTVYSHATLEAALFWAAAASAYLAAGRIFADEETAGRFRGGMAWFGIGLAVLSTLQLYTSDGRIYWLFDSGYTDNVLGPFVYRNNYAAFIELLLPLVVLKALGTDRRRGWFLAGAAVMAASVVASGSRAGAVLVAAELALVAFLCPSARRARAVLLRMGVLIAVLTAVVGGGYLWSRLQEKAPYALRRDYLEASIAMVRDRPWTGFGLGTWPHVYPSYAPRDSGMFANRAHNDWAEWAAEGGLPFAAALVLLVTGLLPRAVRSVWGLGLVAVAVHALVDYPFARLGQAVWWFVMAASVRALPREDDTHGADQDVQIQPQ